MRGLEKWSQHTRQLSELQPGDRVLIQNQHGAGKIAKKWDKSGQIVESLGHGRYRVRVDGSGRVTDRNRQFLRTFTPVTPSLPGPTPSPAGQETGPGPSLNSRPGPSSLTPSMPAPGLLSEQPAVPMLPPEQTPPPPTPPVRPEYSVHVQTPQPGPVSPAAEETETFSTPDSSPVAPRMDQEPSTTQPWSQPPTDTATPYVTSQTRAQCSCSDT